MPAAYDLTPAARQAVRDLWLSTAAQWGERQADRSTGFRETGVRRMAGKKAPSKTCAERSPQGHVTRCQPHEVFCLHPEGQPPLIVAVLHGRMDMLSSIGARLSWPGWPGTQEEES